MFAVTAHRHPRARALFGTVAAIILPIVAVAALHRLGSLEWLRIDFRDLDGWARRSRPEDALAALLRYVALAGGYWLAGSSVLYLLARLSGAARLVDATAVLTFPAVRRMTDRLVIGTLAVSTLAGPAIALSGGWSDDGTAPDPIAARLGADAQGIDDVVVDLTKIDDGDVDRIAPRPPTPPRLVDEPANEQREGESISITAGAHLEVIVTEGDHLWALADRRVSAILGRQAADHEIAPYWREVISSNPEIRSGDPDIIHPGEVIVLPPMP